MGDETRRGQQELAALLTMLRETAGGEFRVYRASIRLL